MSADPRLNRPVRYGGKGRKIVRKRSLAQILAAREAKVRFVGSTHPRPCRDDQATAHRAKMIKKAARRAKDHKELSDPDRVQSLLRCGGSPATFGHQHAREIARRVRQANSINANRENRMHGDRTHGYVMAAGYRMNFSRRGRLVFAAK